MKKIKVGDYVRVLEDTFGYYKGDIGQVVDIRDNMYHVFVPNRESRSCYYPNVSFVLSSLKKIKVPKVGKYYYVEEGDFWMIGKVTKGIDLHSCENKLLRGNAIVFASDKTFKLNSNWCFKNKNRTFKKATENEIKWLDRCIAAGKYLPREDSLSPFIPKGTWVMVKDRGQAVISSFFPLDRPYLLTEDYCIENGFKAIDNYGSIFNGWTNSFNLGMKIRKATNDEVKDYFTSFKIGDWVEVVRESNNDIFVDGRVHGNRDNNNQQKSGDKFKITDAYSGASTLSGYRVKNGSKSICPSLLRKLNKDEIPNEHQSLFFGDVEFIIHDGYAETKYGDVSEGEIDTAISWITNPPYLVGHEFTIHIGDDYLKLKDNATFKIGFGCKSGTLEELEAIQQALSSK